MSLRLRRLAILGLGLIGGSLAAALKARGAVDEVVGWGRRESSLQEGLALGVIDRFSLDLAEAVRDADMVVVATPTLIAEDVIAQLPGLLAPDAILTDVASVKGNIVAAVARAFGGLPACFVPAHPIAGSERSGVAAARADLFQAHRVILTPLPETAAGATQQVTSMWVETGAEVVSMPVADHDAVLANTSHLPHVLAFTLVDALASSPRGEDIFRFAAGGFRDFTRIASSDPTMWRDIALANREALLAAMDDFSGHLRDLRSAIDASDGAAIMAAFERARAARERFLQQAPAARARHQE